jgi:polyvinyl alcohol dehydrogenase (cytochrome)
MVPPRRALAGIVVLAGSTGLVVVMAAGCSSAGHAGRHPPPSPAPRAPVSSPATPGTSFPASTGSTDWPTYHQNAQRTGNVPGLPAAGPLSLAWSTSLDGEVAGQPLIIGGTVVAATEEDAVYALDRTTGKILWRASVGRPLPLADQPCGNLDPLGITSTPVYDPANGLVYVVAQDGATMHVLAGLRLSDGQVVIRRDIPAPDHQPAYDQQRGALALTDGHVYVVFGGHYGDCGPYIGSVVGVPASGHGPIWSYRVPTPKQGGIWAAAGPVVAASGTIYVSSGNGGRFGPPYDGSDSVIELTPQLRRIGVFAPADWAYLSRSDLDLGSMSPALTSDGRILQVGKSGVGYLLNATHLGGVGGELAQAPVCVAFGGAAISGTTVYVPCSGSGLAAVDTAGDRITIAWRSQGTVWGSPVLGGGALFVAQPYDGNLYEVAPGTGRVTGELHIASRLPDFVSPSLSGALVLVGTLDGVVAVRGA